MVANKLSINDNLSSMREKIEADIGLVNEIAKLAKAKVDTCDPRDVALK